MRTVALSGLGGVGKSTAANEYAHRHRNEYSVLYRLHAEDRTQFLHQLREMASRLDPRFAENQDPQLAAYSALAARTTPWLLILDNVVSYEAARLWLPAKGRGHVIVTTRDGNWPQALPVESLAPDAATAYLTEATGQSDPQAVAAIADLVGALPLALAQAASYMRSTGTSAADYLTLLRERRRDMLSRGAPPDHRDPVTLTWSVAMARLESEKPTALALLLTCAFLAPDNIPYKLLFANAKVGHTLLNPLQVEQELRYSGSIPRAHARALVQLRADPVSLGEAIGALRDYSLISEPVNGKLSVHRLVQEVIRHRLSDRRERDWSELVAVLLKAAVPKMSDDRETWPACADLLPHVRARLGPRSAELRDLADGYLRYAGQYSMAREVWTEIAYALATDAGRGPEHPETLAARASLAYWTGAAGNVRAARDRCRELLPIVRRVYGSVALRTLSVRSSLARWTGEAGDPSSARAQYAELLANAKFIFGQEHAFTLSVRASLAQWTGEAGDAPGARDRYAELIPVAERVFGAEDRDTVAIRANLAHWTGVSGDAPTARDRYADLLPVFERVLGAEHRETLAVRANAAHWTGAAGDSKSAHDAYAELVSVTERVLGPEHPDTLVNRANLAYWQRITGNSSVARDEYAALLPIFERVFGGVHRQTVGVWANLARCEPLD